MSCSSKKELEEQLKEAGNILLNPPFATEELLKFLGVSVCVFGFLCATVEKPYPYLSKNYTSEDRLLEQCEKINQQLRSLFTVLIQNAPNVENLQDQHNGHCTKRSCSRRMTRR
ncbi:hypothetical protein DVH24_034986 [Malus domestica]|uniref:Uncharacterized protein n=1 Tax=Malus domestica TaxID=3750 RepID=A0A498IHF0_MALDO|nr:hypothetical protein DVH24_034986 [Malus domestica]